MAPSWPGAYGGSVLRWSRIGTLGIGLLAGTGACDRDAPTPQSVVEASEIAAAVREGLTRAHRAWSAGDRAGAESEVRQTYVADFERLEPRLRARDPTGTLRLEFAFGHLAQTLAGSADPVAVAQEVRGLLDAVDAAAAAADQPRGATAEP